MNGPKQLGVIASQWSEKFLFAHFATAHLLYIGQLTEEASILFMLITDAKPLIKMPAWAPC